MMTTKKKIEEMLAPGGGAAAYEAVQATSQSRCSGWIVYALFSSIKLAMRERADDQARSTERTDISRASAVSTVVKLAK